MDRGSFAHLHTHTEYSMLDGASRLDELVAAAAADGQPALGITDHGNMYGVLDFYAACRNAGINPVIGTEAYMAAESRHERPVRRGRVDDTGGDVGGGEKLYYHLTLLAETTPGYRNLLKLSSAAYLEGYYYKPRVDWELLERHHEGIIATTGCLGGVVLQALLADDEERALKLAGRLQDTFGRDNLFVEVQDHGLPEQKRTNPALVRIARQLGAPLIATNDSHYTHREDAVAHDALLCVQTGALIEDPKRFKFDGEEHYLKSAAEMRALFSEIPEACDSTLQIAERANVEIAFGVNALPEFPVPAEFRGATYEARADAYLRHLTLTHGARRYGSPLPTAVSERIDYELGVIARMGFSAYFLVVWDLIRHARDQRHPGGPGRGSAAGCCVAYCLGIVDLDPIRYDLLFERFLNPGRKQMPDIDMDFDERYRAEMIRYATDRYGADRVAQIVTFSTIKARAAVRDAARVLGYPYIVGDRIAKAMPPLIMGRDTPLRACLDRVEGHEDGYATAQGLRDMYAEDEEARRVIDVAKGLEGLRRQDGIHAAAVVITKEPLTEYLPVQRKPESGQNPAEAPIVTQYEMHGVEELGLLKMDFLGLRNLSVIERALDLIEQTGGVRPDIDAVALDDEPTFEMLRRAETIGVFQLEGGAMRSTLRALAPTSFNDVAALVALYRPGPMAANMHRDYPELKNGRKVLSYLHPDMEADPRRHLRAHAVPGVHHAGGAEVRRLHPRGGRQPPEGVRQEEPRPDRGGAREVREGLRRAGIRLAARHRALRHHRALRRLRLQQVALLRVRPGGVPDGVVEGASPGGVLRRPAHLGQGRQGQDRRVPGRVPGARHRGPRPRRQPLGRRVHAARGRGRRRVASCFGLAAVRNVGESLVDRIVAERDANGPFVDVYDFCRRVDPVVLNKRTMDSLVKAGAFDSLGHPRQGLCLVLEEIVDRTLERRREEQAGITTLFASLEGFGEGDGTATVGYGDPRVPVPDTEFGKTQRLAFEKEMLGLYVSDHPLRGFEGALARLTDCSITDLKDLDDTGGPTRRAARARSAPWAGWSPPCPGATPSGASSWPPSRWRTYGPRSRCSSSPR